MSAQARWDDNRWSRRKRRSITIVSVVPERTAMCRAQESPLEWHKVTVKKAYLIEGNGKTLAAICTAHNYPLLLE